MIRRDRAWQEQLVQLDEDREARVFVNTKAALKVILHDESPPRYEQLYNQLRKAVKNKQQAAIMAAASEITAELQMKSLEFDSIRSKIEALYRDVEEAWRRERDYIDRIVEHGGVDNKEQEIYMHQIAGAADANQACADRLYMIIRQLDTVE